MRFTAALLITGLAVGPTCVATYATAEPANLAGNWALNAWLSDPGEQIAQELRADLGPSGQGDVFNGPQQVGPEGRGGMGGGRGAGRQPEPRRQQERARLTPEDQKRVQSLLDWVQVPPATLTIAQGDGTLTVTDPVHGSRTFQVNGQKQKQTFDSGAIDATTRLEGPQLVTDYDAGHGVAIRFSYMIAPPSNALLLRVSIILPGNQAAPFTIRLVYDRTS